MAIFNHQDGTRESAVTVGANGKSGMIQQYFMDMSTADVKAEFRVIEPVGMTVSELILWYLDQPKPFQRTHKPRINELIYNDIMKGA